MKVCLLLLPFLCVLRNCCRPRPYNFPPAPSSAFDSADAQLQPAGCHGVGSLVKFILLDWQIPQVVREQLTGEAATFEVEFESEVHTTINVVCVDETPETAEIRVMGVMGRRSIRTGRPMPLKFSISMAVISGRLRSVSRPGREAAPAGLPGRAGRARSATRDGNASLSPSGRPGWSVEAELAVRGPPVEGAGRLCGQAGSSSTLGCRPLTSRRDPCDSFSFRLPS